MLIMRGETAEGAAGKKVLMLILEPIDILGVQRGMILSDDLNTFIPELGDNRVKMAVAYCPDVEKLTNTLQKGEKNLHDALAEMVSEEPVIRRAPGKKLKGVIKINVPSGVAPGDVVSRIMGIVEKAINKNMDVPDAEQVDADMRDFEEAFGEEEEPEKKSKQRPRQRGAPPHKHKPR